MDEAFRGVNYLIRWRSRKWMKKPLLFLKKIQSGLKRLQLLVDFSFEKLELSAVVHLP